MRAGWSRGAAADVGRAGRTQSFEDTVEGRRDRALRPRPSHDRGDCHLWSEPESVAPLRNSRCLAVGPELAREGFHGPVADSLGTALAVPVSHLAHRAARLAAQARRLFDLAEGCMPIRLAWFELALRE